MTTTSITGTVQAIHIAASAQGEMLAIDEVSAIAGKGLTGDRYAAAEGTFSNFLAEKHKDHELTLIEAEAIEALNQLPGITITPGQSRRNITTRGVSLNEWIGKEFTIGTVRCKGTRLCQPCAHLQKLLPIPNLLQIVHNRGGLRAVIIEGGVIRVGDKIKISI